MQYLFCGMTLKYSDTIQAINFSEQKLKKKIIMKYLGEPTFVSVFIVNYKS
jgi:hypothetical protein